MMVVGFGLLSGFFFFFLSLDLQFLILHKRHVLLMQAGDCKNCHLLECKQERGTRL